MSGCRQTVRALGRAAVSLAVLILTGCGSPAGDDTARSNANTLPLRVMSFNIEWGGAHVRFDSVVEAIRAAGADVVGVQEPEGNLERLANDLGWHYNRRNHVVSRFPLIDPPDGGGHYVFVEVAPGSVVAIANVHLPSDPYGVDWLRDGRAADDVMALERNVRLPEIEPLLRTLPALYRRGVAVFLTGDFNSPSHADWTSAAVGRFPHREIAFEWPVSRAIAGAGLRDSFRTVHPDPVTHPGFTWWAARPRIEDYNPSDPTHQDRIDMLWYAGPANVTASRLVGEAGARGVSISVSPWPSDHRAVVSEFDVQAAPMPVLVATEKRVYESGEVVRVTYRSARQASVVLMQAGTKDGEPQRRVAVDAGRGRLQLASDDVAPGPYRIALIDAEGETISRNELWILAPDAAPFVDVEGDSFAPGAPLPLAWGNAPGNRLDWIAIVDAGSPTDSESYMAYSYVDARSSGTMQLDARTAEGTWPLPPGRYLARLMLDDGFAVLAESAPFAVE